MGVGLIVADTTIGLPSHPLAVGVIVKFTICTELVVLVSVPVIAPLPLAAIPVVFTVLSLVQL